MAKHFQREIEFKFQTTIIGRKVRSVRSWRHLVTLSILQTVAMVSIGMRPSLKSMLIFYWIKFAIAQMDDAEAEIDSKYLILQDG